MPSELSVDVHAHVWLDEVQALVAEQPGLAAAGEVDRRRFGDEALAVSRKNVAARWPLMVDPDARIEHMDRAAVDVQVVSMSPTQYHPWADRGLAHEIAVAANELVASHCDRHLTRLTGLGYAPIQHPGLAAEALEDAVKMHGLRGVEISSHAQSSTGQFVELSNPELDELWEKAVDLDAVIFMHPWGCTLDARLCSNYMGNSVGQPVEHTVALSHLILSGVLDRFPQLRLIAGHGGGYLPAGIARVDHAWLNREDARGCQRVPSSYLSSLWFDSLVYTPAALQGLVLAAGKSQVLLGSDYPFDMGVDDPVRLLEEAGLDNDVVNAIRGGNARELGLLPVGTAQEPDSDE